ncbi:MAG: hypothetical protein LBO70_06985 [Clostridiales Family XIII bacterium]|jgi:prefoldin subunit 5|nr:hypothetical protein [Clostridiales Family XIII bacterium]
MTGVGKNISARLIAICLAVLMSLVFVPTVGGSGSGYDAYADGDEVVLTVKVQLGSDGVPESAKTYTEAQLREMADITTNAGYPGSTGSSPRMYKTRNAVTLEKLVKDALETDTAFTSDAVYKVTDMAEPLNPYSGSFTYNEVTSDSKFYPAMGADYANDGVVPSAEGAVAVPPALALTSTLDNISSTAGGDLASWDGKDTNAKNMQFLIGVSEEIYKGKKISGKKLVTGVDEITVIRYADKTSGDLRKELDDIKEKADELDKELAKEKADVARKNAENARLAQEKAQLEKDKALLFKAVSARISKLKAGKRSAAVTWGKIDSAQGYQLVYSTSKKFKGQKTVNVSGSSTVKNTVKKLKKGKTYYFKVRGYAKVGGNTVYTKYSPSKNVKIK